VKRLYYSFVYVTLSLIVLRCIAYRSCGITASHAYIFEWSYENKHQQHGEESDSRDWEGSEDTIPALE
jgi:hypothetical protein